MGEVLASTSRAEVLLTSLTDLPTPSATASRIPPTASPSRASSARCIASPPAALEAKRRRVWGSVILLVPHLHPVVSYQSSPGPDRPAQGTTPDRRRPWPQAASAGLNRVVQLAAARTGRRLLRDAQPPPEAVAVQKRRAAERSARRGQQRHQVRAPIRQRPAELERALSGTSPVHLRLQHPAQGRRRSPSTIGT